MINISESALSSLIPKHTPALISHAAAHLRRVYPRGTRVASSNLNPLHFWRNGSHIAALNWQKYDRGTQMNEAMFIGTPGFVLKPDALLPGAVESGPQRQRLKCEIIALSSRESGTLFRNSFALTLDGISAPRRRCIANGSVPSSAIISFWRPEGTSQQNRQVPGCAHPRAPRRLQVG